MVRNLYNGFEEYVSNLDISGMSRSGSIEHTKRALDSESLRKDFIQEFINSLDDIIKIEDYLPPNEEIVNLMQETIESA
ncbi:hypothetical protein MK079_04385, partial [Candidatus Gracilibacteria bacterium]|nr:hypothetical protein [Candidatus Gracilibacteria bacterium]